MQLKGKIIIAVILVLVVTGSILIALWQTGILFGPKVDPTPVTPTPTMAVLKAFDIIPSDFYPQSLVPTIVTGTTVATVSLSFDGTKMFQSVVDINDRDHAFFIKEYSRSSVSLREWGTASEKKDGTFYVYSAAWNSDGSEIALVTQDSGEANNLAYKVRFRTDEVDAVDVVKSISNFSFSRTALTQSVWFDIYQAIPTVVLGYYWQDVDIPSLSQYHAMQYTKTNGTWSEFQTLTELTGNTREIHGVSLHTMLTRATVNEVVQFVPFRRESATAAWTKQTPLAGSSGAIAGAVTNFGNFIIGLLTGGIPVAYKWDKVNATYSSLNFDGTPLSFGSGAKPEDYIVVSSNNSPFFVILCNGTDVENAKMALYRVPSETDGTVLNTATQSTIMTPLKMWTFNSTYVSGPVLKVNWSDDYGLDIDGSLLASTRDTSVTFHVNCH
jgi:hypothetical protein